LHHLYGLTKQFRSVKPTGRCDPCPQKEIALIVRGPRPADNFAQIHNAALADGRLSYKARGILAYLLSRPPGWKTSAERLAQTGVDGERAVKSGLKELETHGYLIRTRTHGEDGKWVHTQVITDQPESTIGAKQPDGEILGPDLDTIGAFCTGGKQPDINNTETTNTKESDLVVEGVSTSPSGEGSTPPPSRDSQGLNRDGVGGPAPARQRRGWYPSDNAIATAERAVELMDIPIHIARYTVVKAEANKEPTSGEWLRWILADEQKARDEERRLAAQAKPAKWFSVAD
jgi:hypothetical protein